MLHRPHNDGNNHIEMVQVQFEEVTTRYEAIGMNRRRRKGWRHLEFDLLRLGTRSRAGFTGSLERGLL